MRVYTHMCVSPSCMGPALCLSLALLSVLSNARPRPRVCWRLMMCIRVLCCRSAEPRQVERARRVEQHSASHPSLSCHSGSEHWVVEPPAHLIPSPTSLSLVVPTLSLHAQCSHAPSCSSCLGTQWQMFSGNAGKTVRLPDRKAHDTKSSIKFFLCHLFLFCWRTHQSLFFPSCLDKPQQHKVCQASNSMGVCFRSGKLDAYNRL